MKISVITATRNSSLTILDAIKSLNDQDYHNIEHIVIDGASTDETLNIVKTFRKRETIVVSEKDKGIYDALNKGLELATGDVVGFLHSDDIFADNKVLSRVAKEFNKGAIDAVYGDLHYVSKSDITKLIRIWDGGIFNRNKFKYGWMPPHPTFYMKREHYLSLGSFKIKYSISADYDSMLRYLWKNKLCAVYISDVLIKMRVGGKSNNSFFNILRKTNEDRLVMIENGISPARGLLYKNLSKIKQFF